MSLNQATKENLETIIHSMANRLQVVNRSIMDPEDYDLEKYEEIKELHDMIELKGQLSISETQAFVDELGKHRK